MAEVNPYLNFNGNCEEAFSFYKSVFGGEFTQFVRFKDMPSDHPKPESVKEKIMHVSLPVSDTTIMGSDSPEGFGPPLTIGNNFSISINTESEAEATKIFNGLSAGGDVTMPLGKAPWGAFFGMFTDKFKINWMVNYDYNK